MPVSRYTPRPVVWSVCVCVNHLFIFHFNIPARIHPTTSSLILVEINWRKQRHSELNTLFFQQKLCQYLLGLHRFKKPWNPASLPSTTEPSFIHQNQAWHWLEGYVWSVRLFNLALWPNLKKVHKYSICHQMAVFHSCFFSVIRVISKQSQNQQAAKNKLCFGSLWFDIKSKNIFYPKKCEATADCWWGLDWRHLLLLDIPINTFCCRINTFSNRR